MTLEYNENIIREVEWQEMLEEMYVKRNFWTYKKTRTKRYCDKIQDIKKRFFNFLNKDLKLLKVNFYVFINFVSKVY